MAAIEPKIIYQETNPYGSLNAFLDDDGRTVYLYLQPIHNPEIPMRSLWIKNRIIAPDVRSDDDFKSGLAPILCKDELTSNAESDEIIVDDLHFIWTEEGDGLAVFIKEKLFAFLPPWSGIKGIHGYSRYAKVETITAYPLGDSDNGIIADRVKKSREFWEFRSEKDSWKKIQATRLEYLEERLGKHKFYWSADGGKFPHLAIAKFQPSDYPELTIYATIGMSAQNMPTVELYHKDYLKYSRIEMIFAIRTNEGDKSDSWIPHAIGEIIKFPWSMCKWFGEGHTISLPRKDPDAVSVDFTHLFLTSMPGAFKNEKSLLEPPCLDFIKGENNQDFRFLYLIPISQEETFFAKENGAKSLLERINTNGNGWVHVSDRESYL
jgi:hypothetical protein